MIRNLLVSVLFLASVMVVGQPKDTSNTVKYFYDTGELSSEGPIEDGKPNGYWYSYFKNGKIKTEGNRVDFKLEGVWKFYNESGFLTLEIAYREGVKEGERIVYKDGKPRKKEYYDNDKRNGLATYFYPSGEIEKIIPYVDDREVGDGFTFDETGQVQTLLTYKNGVLVKKQPVNRVDKQNQKVGVWMGFFPESYLIKFEGTYQKGLKHGFWKYFKRDGSLLRMEKWINGVLQEGVKETEKIEIKRLLNPKTGKIASIGAYKNGKKEGVHRQYNDEGEVVSSQIYEEDFLLAEGIVDENGWKQGPWKFYFLDGELKSEGSYKDDLKVGKWNYYFENGVLEQTGSYLRGNPDGLWQWFYPNEELRKEEEFVDGYEDGLSVEYADSNEVVIAKGNYVDGFKDGEWVYNVNGLITKGKYFEGEKEGTWITRYEDSNEKQFEGAYVGDVPNGSHVFYYPNGKVKRRGKYEMGVRQGIWEYFTAAGEIRLTIEYDGNGKEIKYNGKKITYGRRIDRELEEEEQ